MNGGRRYEYVTTSSRDLQSTLDEIEDRGASLHTIIRGDGFVDMGHHLTLWHLVIEWPNVAVA